MLEYKIKSFDDNLINIKEYNEIEKPVGIVQILHSTGENSDHYQELASFFNNKGLVVFIQDLRGHGKNITDLKKASLYNGDIFYDTVRDTVFFAKALKQKYSLPIILLGHGFGSFVAMRTMQLCEDFSTLVLSGCANLKKNPFLYPALGFANLGWIIKGRNTKARTLNNLTVKKYNKKFQDKNWLTTDLEKQKELVPEKGANKILSFNFYKYFLKGVIDSNRSKNLSKINSNVPILIVAGRKDALNKDGEYVSALKRSLKSAGITTVHRKIYDKKRHSILQESNRKEVYKDIYDFIISNKVITIKKEINSNATRPNQKRQLAGLKRKKQAKKSRS